MGQLVYGYGGIPAFGASNGAFVSKKQNDNWVPTLGTLIACVQDDIQCIVDATPVSNTFLLEIPDDQIPINATGITVTMAMALRMDGPEGFTAGVRCVAKTGSGINNLFLPPSTLDPVGPFVIYISDPTTLDGNFVTLTRGTFLNTAWGFSASILSGVRIFLNKFALLVEWAESPTSDTAIDSTQVIGTTSRVGVSRVGCTRVAAVPDVNNLDNHGVYRWKRSGNSPLAVPPSSVINSWNYDGPPA